MCGPVYVNCRQLDNRHLTAFSANKVYHFVRRLPQQGNKFNQNQVQGPFKKMKSLTGS